MAKRVDRHYTETDVKFVGVGRDKATIVYIKVLYDGTLAIEPGEGRKLVTRVGEGGKIVVVGTEAETEIVATPWGEGERDVT